MVINIVPNPTGIQASRHPVVWDPRMCGVELSGIIAYCESVAKVTVEMQSLSKILVDKDCISTDKDKDKNPHYMSLMTSFGR